VEEIARIDEERERGVSYDLRMLSVPLFEQSREVVECEQRRRVLFNKHEPNLPSLPLPLTHSIYLILSILTNGWRTFSV